MKTLTNAQLGWMVKKGFAWEDEGNNGSLRDTFWTREGGYQWDVDRQIWELVF